MGEDRKQPRIWIDTDVALGALRGDVDDGFAIAAVLGAVRRGEAELLGVSSVFGNTSGETASWCARALLDAAGHSAIPVVHGARRAGEVTPAAEAIAALPADTRLLALGPLTNVAAALARDPDLAGRVEVRLVGGNLRSLGRWPPLWPFEFNLAKDARAAAEVLASAVPRRIFPLDVCVRLKARRRDLLRWTGLSPVGGYLAARSWRWLAYAPLRYRALSFPLWDVVPALDALDLLDARFETRWLRLEGRGRLVPDPAAPASLCARWFDAPAAMAVLDERIHAA
jgi:inosine-uridine nucleoside N-ribohydrolase